MANRIGAFILKGMVLMSSYHYFISLASSLLKCVCRTQDITCPSEITELVMGTNVASQHKLCPLASSFLFHPAHPKCSLASQMGTASAPSLVLPWVLSLPPQAGAHLRAIGGRLLGSGGRCCSLFRQSLLPVWL